MAHERPLELVVMDFPEAEVPEAVDGALRRLTFLGDLRVVEAAAIAKDADGNCRRREVDHLVTAKGSGELPSEPSVLVPSEVDGIGRMLGPGRTALALVLEHTWIGELGDAFTRVGGEVLASAWLAADGLATASAPGGRHAADDH
jgi:hypothetical protein